MDFANVVEDPTPEVGVFAAGGEVAKRSFNHLCEQGVGTMSKGGLARTSPELASIELGTPKVADFRHAAAGGHEAGEAEEAVPELFAGFGVGGAEGGSKFFGA